MATGKASEAREAAESSPRLAILALVAVALALRIWEAAESSLWLDELHTLAHASLPTASDVVGHVRREVVHQPGFFLFVHLFGGWEEGALLRAIPVISSLALFAPLLAFAGRGGLGRAPTLLAVALLACLPYQVHYATELRPYAWLAAFSAGAAYAAFSESGSRWSRIALFVVCVAAGVWTHRLMEFVVVSIGAARLLVRSRAMVPLTWLIAAGALAVAPELPWLLDYARKATEDRVGYQEEHGGFRLRPALVQEALALPVRLFTPYLGALGGAWSLIARIAAVAFFTASAASLVTLFRRLRANSIPPPMRALAWFAVIDFALVAGLSFYRWDRLPLQYFAPVAWILPLIVALGVERASGCLRASLTAVLAISALALGVAQAGGRCTEDMRGAVEVARELGASLDRPLYTGLLSQPDLFSDTLPFRAYGRDLEIVESSDVPRRGAGDFERPLVLLRRGRIEADDEGWKSLIDGRRVAREAQVDLYLTVLVLEPAP